MVPSHFPLGLGYIAAFLREKGHNVHLLLDATKKRIEDELNTFQPQVVGISCMTPTFPGALDICLTVKEKCDAVTVLGGVHISALKEEILPGQPQVDFLVYGEGEETMAELCQVLEQGGKDFSQIRGLVWRPSAQRIQINKPRPYIRDINRLPFPARDLVDLSSLGIHRYVAMGRRSASMINSRGCPNECAFCSSRFTLGRGYRHRTADNVIAEVDELVQRYGINHIYFEDDTFTALPDRTKELCERLLLRNYDLTWNCLTRVDTMTEDLARLMKRAGCRMVSFGIESADQETLQKIHKKISLAQAEKAVEACYRARLRTQCTFILGFPFDSYHSMLQTLHFAQKLSPAIAMFFCLIPYPGTELFKYLPPEQKPKEPDDWKKFVNYATFAITGSGISLAPGISGTELIKFSDKCHLRFYLRPKQLWRMFLTLDSMEGFYNFLISGWSLLHKVSQTIFKLNY